MLTEILVPLSRQTIELSTATSLLQPIDLTALRPGQLYRIRFEGDHTQAVLLSTDNPATLYESVDAGSKEVRGTFERGNASHPQFVSASADTDCTVVVYRVSMGTSN